MTTDKPSDGAVSRAFWERYITITAPDHITYSPEMMTLDGIRHHARELDAATPRDTQAGDVEWLASELEKLSHDFEPGLPSWALLIWSANAIRRLTRTAEREKEL